MAKKVAKKVATKVVAAKKVSKKVAEEETEIQETPKNDPKAKMAKARAAQDRKTSKQSMGDPEKTYRSIKDLITLIDEDIDKFLVNETRSAGRRIRGYAQQVRKLCVSFRKEIQGLQNERKENK